LRARVGVRRAVGAYANAESAPFGACEHTGTGSCEGKGASLGEGKESLEPCSRLGVGLSACKTFAVHKGPCAQDLPSIDRDQRTVPLRAILGAHQGCLGF